MEKVRSEMDSRQYCYRFYSHEEEAIAEGLKLIVVKLRKKVQLIVDDPKNEGQATYSVKIAEIQSEIRDLEEIIEEFK